MIPLKKIWRWVVSLYLGKDSNNKALLHVTDSTISKDIISTGLDTSATIFNTNNSFMTIHSVETVTPIVVRNDVYVYTLEWVGTNVGTDFFYIVTEVPLDNVLVGNKVVDGKTYIGLPSLSVFPSVNGRVPFINTLYNSNVENSLYRAHKQFLMSYNGNLQFKSGSDDLGSGSFPTYGVKFVNVTRVNYSQFVNTTGHIEVGPDTFTIGGFDLKAAMMLSATTSPNIYDYKVMIGGGLYFQFINEYSVRNQFNGLGITNEGIVSGVNGSMYEVITKNIKPSVKTSKSVGFSVTLLGSGDDRRYIVTTSSVFVAAFIKTSATRSGNINSYKAAAWVPSTDMGLQQLYPSLPITEAVDTPAVHIEATSSSTITIYAPTTWDGYYYYRVIIDSIDIMY